MIEKKLKLAYLSQISTYLSWFFFLYVNGFLIVQNQIGILLSTVGIVNSQMEQKHKSIILWQLFSISNLRNSWRLTDSL